MQYLDQWPVAEWGPVDYSEICVMAPSVTQVCFVVLCLLQLIHMRCSTCMYGKKFGFLLQNKCDPLSKNLFIVKIH